MKTIDLIVPCYNEEEGLEHFVLETNKVIDSMPEYSFRYILVNDGSKDKTYLVMKKLAKQFPNVKYISFSRNFGKEAAMYAGLQHSTADYVVVMDADLQHPPTLFPQWQTLSKTRATMSAPQSVTNERAKANSEEFSQKCSLLFQINSLIPKCRTALWISE